MKNTEPLSYIIANIEQFPSKIRSVRISAVLFNIVLEVSMSAVK